MYFVRRALRALPALAAHASTRSMGQHVQVSRPQTFSRHQVLYARHCVPPPNPRVRPFPTRRRQQRPGLPPNRLLTNPRPFSAELGSSHVTGLGKFSVRERRSWQARPSHMILAHRPEQTHHLRKLHFSQGWFVRGACIPLHSPPCITATYAPSKCHH